MEAKDFIFTNNGNVLPEGRVTWKSPSNIALVKYWGKSEGQIPKNTSLSFTLNASATITRLEYFPLTIRSKDTVEFDIYFDAKKKDEFKPKIAVFFERIKNYVPFIADYRFKIHTRNTFPHSSGIASSASGLSAIALGIMQMEKKLNPLLTEDYLYKKASFLARLGSGSAARSIKGSIVVWGAHKAIPESSDLYGIAFPYKVHPIFKKFHDTILLVDKGQKKVSSSFGHNLMKHHPFAKKRFIQAQKNIHVLSNVLQKGLLKEFIEIVESEALSLHAMMMTSNPYFILMQPNTLAIILKIWDYRDKTGATICFTLDAGANVHVLYPEGEKHEIYKFITEELVTHCQNNQYICDRIGFGSKMLTQ